MLRRRRCWVWGWRWETECLAAEELRSGIVTFATAAWRARARVRPIPEAPPVTRAVLFLRMEGSRGVVKSIGVEAMVVRWNFSCVELILRWMC